MDFDLQSIFVAEGSGLQLPSYVGQGSEDRSFNSVFAGGSFPTVSSMINLDRTLFQGADYGIGTTQLGFPYILTSDPVALSYFTEDLQQFQQKQLSDCSINGEKRLNSINFSAEKLKLPKSEPDQPNVSDSTFELCRSSFHDLPDLQSLEQVSNLEMGEQYPDTLHLQENFSNVESSLKRLRSSSLTDSYKLDSIVRNLPSPNPSFFPLFHPPNPPSPPVIPQSVLARQRRRKISDRTQCLQKLMPWDKKMDMATMLEEAYKYIKFLKAQVSVLQSMSSESSFTSHIPVAAGDYAGLEKLNRQQLLQVVLNSPVAQTMMCSKECCVVSLEQLLFLKNINGRKILQQQMLLGASSGRVEASSKYFNGYSLS
ncbi:hypothetical protein HHK36_023760 [Tetracentron sinense]|uniref:BHLH domain-containing protein n=1 Tax=Tetracentron sinense TaxID=13715 RepID=A0A834YQR5_TETSI|nr:hypothetical protein HHK36_023760 [Tetracentron sinense]